MCETKNDFKSDEKESLERILQEKLKWVSDAHQFAGNWDNSDRRLRKQLPEIPKAITQWQQAVVNHWEATGYRHNAQGASQLIEQRPVRVHVNSGFTADALDSADLACIMLHTTAQSSWSGISEAIKAPGDHQLTISRYGRMSACDLHEPACAVTTSVMGQSFVRLPMNSLPSNTVTAEQNYLVFTKAEWTSLYIGILTSCRMPWLRGQPKLCLFKHTRGPKAACWVRQWIRSGPKRWCRTCQW